MIHVHGPPEFLILAALVPKLTGSKVILDVVDLGSELFTLRFNHVKGIRIVESLLRHIELWAASVADVVITVHDPYRRMLVDRGVEAEKVVVVHNSFDIPLEAYEVKARDPNEIRIVYHGTITPHYGVELLIAAMPLVAAVIPTVVADIYGEGDAAPAIDVEIKRRGLGSLVNLALGHIRHGAVLREVSGAAAGVISNLPVPRNERIVPTKLFEYVALEIPVVSADLPGVREYFSEEEVTFFRAGDSSALASTLIEVIQNPRETERKVAAARRRLENYRWSTQKAVYEGVLSRLVPSACQPCSSPGSTKQSATDELLEPLAVGGGDRRRAVRS